MRRRQSLKNKRLLAGPYLLWAVSFVVIPLLMIFYYGMTTETGSFTWDNIARTAMPENLKALGIALLLAFVSTVICLLLAYPLAMILSRKNVNQSSFIVLIFILPMWMNFLLRTLAWQTLLEKTGVINSILNILHLPSLDIINTPYAIVLGMVYNFLPFMVLPIYNSLCKIDADIVSAARDLGANAFQTFIKITLPLTVPGIISGITMVFVPALTTFVISDLLGGGKILLIGNVIEQAFKPIRPLIVLSFNASRTRAKWGGATLHWYQELFKNEAIMSALYSTLLIALLSALIATFIGTAAAIGIQSMKRKFRTFYMGLTNIPMMNAEIVMGISLMLLFIAFRINLGFSTILIAHITFNIPYVILSVMPRLKQTNRHTYEAALDLGASPLYAFFKVIFPDILPGVLSGFMLAFTMSLDDFVITHFTKGPGIDTLSTKIYSEVRKGIKPEMYALSTLLFISVLLLLLLINFSPKDSSQKARKQTITRRSRALAFAFKRVIPALLVLAVTAGGIYYSFQGQKRSKQKVIVYNWGEYLDPEVITMFEEETGIDVIYEEFETNEIMYPKVQSGAIAYDVVCPSDYMIQKMLDNGLLAEINFDNVPNLKNIGQRYMDKSREFDPENKYSVPYCWGTVGILYNKTMVDEPIDSWSILWDDKYRDNILMQDSVRDAFGVTLKYLGYSLNSTDLDELTEAMNLLIVQKPLVQAYVIDQVRDKMIGNEAAIGVIYSGEAIYTQNENPDLEYVIPKEGSNIWIDSWVIPKNAEHKENAEAFINFLCRPDIALMNFDYITYSTPNTAARELIEDEDIRNSKIAFPDDSELEHCETFHYLGDEADAVYMDLWNKVKSK